MTVGKEKDLPPIVMESPEVKAAAIDVVTRLGIENNLEVVYADNIPRQIGEYTEELPQIILNLAKKAKEHFQRGRS